MQASSHSFRVLAKDQDSQARLGVLMGPFGAVATPAFMPVGTHGAVRALTAEDLEKLGVGMILANALHLYLRPGVDLVERLGGLKGFMGYQGGILTDSGGYQVFSLSPFVKVLDDAVVFRSPLDGAMHRLSPKDVVEIQERIGSDIHMPLDHPVGYPAPKAWAQEALGRTMDWLKASLVAKNPERGELFGIIQGGVFEELRVRAAQEVSELPVAGFALGGFSLGEPKALMWELVSKTIERLDSGRPRYLMGVGTPADLLEGVRLGVDMFDCILPTRLARHGQLYTSEGSVRLKNVLSRGKEEPLDSSCDCYTCREFSLGYLAHLYRIRDPSALRLNTLHNLRYYGKLLEEARHSIGSGGYDKWATAKLSGWRPEREKNG